MGAVDENTALTVRALTGAMRSGKTEVLVQRVRELLADGVLAADILLVTPSRDGAATLGRRVRETCGAQAAGMRVTSARALELAVLETQMGARPRLLLDVEQSILLADLKAAGVAPSELAGLLDRAAAAWGDGVPLEGETACALQAALERRGALLPQEVAYRAREAVRDDAALAARFGASYVLVDDANGLSRAALELVRSLAGTELLLVGNPAWDNTLFDPGARADAFVTLASAAVEPGVGETRASGHGAMPATPGVAPQGFSAAPVERMAVKWLGLEEEMTGAVTATLLKVRDQVARQRELGIVGAPGDAELPSYCAAQVAVAVPAKAYAAGLARALDAREQPVSQFLARQPIAGDPRRRKTCPELAVFAALGILANERDAASWRTWVALGRADLASAPWCALEAYAAERGCHVVDALANLGDATFEGAAELVQAYAQGCELRERYGSRVGFGLLKAADPAGSSVVLELCEPLGGEEPAAVVFGQLCANVFDRHYSTNPACVRVGCPESFMGMEPLSILALGCNKGVVPSEDDPARSERESQALLHALVCARESSVASYAQRCPVETAAKLGACYRRTRREGSQELAVLMPSPVLAALGHDAPPTLSGQQYASVVLGVRP